MHVDPFSPVAYILVRVQPESVTGPSLIGHVFIMCYDTVTQKKANDVFEGLFEQTAGSKLQSPVVSRDSVKGSHQNTGEQYHVMLFSCHPHPLYPFHNQCVPK